MASSDQLPESDDRVREVRRCIEVIRDRKLFDVPTSVATMRTLEKIHANIGNAPDDPKYRRLCLTNPRVAKLLNSKGVQQLLVKAGWRAAVEQMEEIWLHDGGPETIPLVRTTRHILETLANADEQAHLAAERKRSETLAKMSKEREQTLREVKADHERRLERHGKLNDTSTQLLMGAGASATLAPQATAAAADAASSDAESDSVGKVKTS